MVDLNLAIEMQDIAEIQRKIGAAQRGPVHGSDVGDDEYDDAVAIRKQRRRDRNLVERIQRTKAQMLFLSKAAVNLNDQHC